MGRYQNYRKVISGFDKCLCIGPHVQSTGGIGRFKIISNDFVNRVLLIKV
ncbi:MAG: alanine-tRNA synthetase second additional domain-containing protein [bacterium]|nr:alanine-tRNA synthetase second additional domain-containing protein [bacterium]